VIHIDLNIESSTINASVMEEICVRLRRDIAGFVSRHVDQVADDRGYRFSYRDVEITGTVKQLPRVLTKSAQPVKA